MQDGEAKCKQPRPSHFHHKKSSKTLAATLFGQWLEIHSKLSSWVKEVMHDSVCVILSGSSIDINHEEPTKDQALRAASLFVAASPSCLHHAPCIRKLPNGSQSSVLIRRQNLCQPLQPLCQNGKGTLCYAATRSKALHVAVSTQAPRPVTKIGLGRSPRIRREKDPLWFETWLARKPAGLDGSYDDPLSREWLQSIGEGGSLPPNGVPNQQGRSGVCRNRVMSACEWVWPQKVPLKVLSNTNTTSTSGRGMVLEGLGFTSYLFLHNKPEPWILGSHGILGLGSS